MVLHNFIVFEGIDGAGTSTQLERLRARADSERFWFTAEPTDAPTGRFLRSMLRGDITLDPRTAAYLFAADRVEHVWGHGGASADAGNGFVSTRAADGGSASAGAAEAQNGAANMGVTEAQNANARTQAASGNSNVAEARGGGMTTRAAVAENGVTSADMLRNGNSSAAEAQSGAVSTHAADGNIGAASISAQCARGKLVVSDRYFFSSLAYQSIDCGMELPLALNSIFPLPELLFFFDITPSQSLARVDSRGEREIYENEPFLKQVCAAYRQVLERYADSGIKIVVLDARESPEQLAAHIAGEIKSRYGI